MLIGNVATLDVTRKVFLKYMGIWSFPVAQWVKNATAVAQVSVKL